MNKELSRRRFLQISTEAAALLIAAGCSPFTSIGDTTDVQPTSIPVEGITQETSSDIPFSITQFEIVQVDGSTTEVAINVCTQGRPTDTTLRVWVYTEPVGSPIDLTALDLSKWDTLKEHSAHCFTETDRPTWMLPEGVSGQYLFKVEARPKEAKGDWKDESVKVEYKAFQFPL